MGNELKHLSEEIYLKFTTCPYEYTEQKLGHGPREILVD
jgi:hypothetical protein